MLNWRSPHAFAHAFFILYAQAGYRGEVSPPYPPSARFTTQRKRLKVPLCFASLHTKTLLDLLHRERSIGGKLFYSLSLPTHHPTVSHVSFHVCAHCSTWNTSARVCSLYCSTWNTLPQQQQPPTSNAAPHRKPNPPKDPPTHPQIIEKNM